VAVTNWDLLDEDGNSVFGQADPARPLAVASWNRLRPPASAPDAQEQFLRRTLKTTNYVAGLAIGIRDYAAYDCCMTTPTSLAELDRKPLAFCPECVQKVWWVSDTDPLERYASLMEFVSKHHLLAEEKFWKQSMEVVRGLTEREQPAIEDSNQIKSNHSPPTP
jgi:hypothetical protein